VPARSRLDNSPPLEERAPSPCCGSASCAFAAGLPQESALFPRWFHPAPIGVPVVDRPPQSRIGASPPAHSRRTRFEGSRPGRRRRGFPMLDIYFKLAAPAFNGALRAIWQIPRGPITDLHGEVLDWIPRLRVADFPGDVHGFGGSLRPEDDGVLVCGRSEINHSAGVLRGVDSQGIGLVGASRQMNRPSGSRFADQLNPRPSLLIR